MATPLSRMLPQIVTLNVPDQPFSYYTPGNQITGWWDIAKVTSLYPNQVTHVDEAHRLTVSLKEADGTFDYNEACTSAEWEVGFTDDRFELGGEMDWHTGKRVEKTWSFQFGGLNRSSIDGSEPKMGVDPVVLSFATSRIKDPLFGWLQSHSWNHKGLLGKVFAQ